MLCLPVRQTLTAVAAGLVLATPALAGTPSADEILDRSRQAMGGKAIDRIMSYTASSEMISPMGTMTAVIFWNKSGRVAIKQTMPQMGEMEIGSDGTIGWMKHPMMGFQLMEGQQLKEVKQQAIHARVLNLRQTMTEEQEKIVGVAESEFDGVACHELHFRNLEVADAQGSIFFDVETGLIRGFSMVEDRGGMPTEATIKLKEWKEIDGVRFFHQMDVEGGPMSIGVHFNKIELNSVNPEVFAVPDEVKKLAGKESKPVSEMKLEDFSPSVQQMINSILSGLPMDDATALRAARQQLATQADRAPGEFGKGMKYVLQRIDERLEQLPGASE